jgi:wobble nucleotide-excising tRNase
LYICSGGRNVTTIFICIFIGMEKDIEILESEVKELEEAIEEYYRSPEFEAYVIQLEKSMENLNINL